MQPKAVLYRTAAPARRSVIAHPGHWQLARGWRPALSLLVLAIIWEVIGQLRLNESFPPLSTVAVAWVGLITSGRLAKELAMTTLTFAAGLAVAIVGGLLIGLLIGRYRWADRLLGPYLYAIMAAPSLAYVPLLVIWFGTDFVSRTCIVVLFAIFPIILNTVAGVRHADATLVEMAQSFQATRQQVLWKVLLPGAIPLVMAGIRLGTGRAVKGVITAEMLLTIVGLGGLIQSFGSSYRTDLLLALVATVVVFGLVITEGVKALDRRLTRWSVGATRGR